MCHNLVGGNKLTILLPVKVKQNVERAFWWLRSSSSNEPRHDKTNKMSVRPAKTQISLGIRPVWSESSLCAQWVAKDPSFLMRTAKTLIRLGGCPGWSESSMGALSLCWFFAHVVLQIQIGFLTKQDARLYNYGNLFRVSECFCILSRVCMLTDSAPATWLSWKDSDNGNQTNHDIQKPKFHFWGK